MLKATVREGLIIKGGIVTSSACSKIETHLTILRKCEKEIDFYIVKDHRCEFENIASRYAYKNMRLQSENFDAHTESCLFDRQQVNIVTRLFSRQELVKFYKNGNCLNLHLAQGAVNQARGEKLLSVGAASHYFDKGVGIDELIIQFEIPIDKSDSGEDTNSSSHFLTVFFLLQILTLFFPSILKTDVNFNQLNYQLAKPSLIDRQILDVFYGYSARKNDLFGYL